MSELNMREEFEKWFSNNGEHPKAVERSGDGYILMQADSSWLTWQAAWNRRAPEAGQHGGAAPSCEFCGLLGGEHLPNCDKTQAQAEPTAAESLNPNAKLSQEGVFAFAGISEPAEGQEPVASEEEQFKRWLLASKYYQVIRGLSVNEQQIAWDAWQARSRLYAQPQRPIALQELPRYRMDMEPDSSGAYHQFLRSDPNGEFVKWSDVQLVQPQRPAVPNGLAEIIAVAIFGASDEPAKEVRRIALRGHNEEDFGGLNLIALTRVIQAALTATERPAVPGDLETLLFTLRDKAGEELADNEDSYIGKLLMGAVNAIESLTAAPAPEKCSDCNGKGWNWLAGAQAHETNKYPCEPCNGTGKKPPMHAKPIPATPIGWKLVPIEPTEYMKDMGNNLLRDFDECAGDVWSEMLAAAPAPERPKPDIFMDEKLLRHVKAVVSHWAEFGPEHGFDESMLYLSEALKEQPNGQG